MRHHRFGCDAVAVAAGLLGLLLMVNPVSIQTCHAGPEPPSLTAGEQRTLFQAQQAISAKDYAAAETILTGHLKSNSGAAQYLLFFSLGNALAMSGKNAEALEEYRNAVRSYPGDAAVWQNMGKIYYELQQYARAGESLARAYALSTPPSSSTGYQAAVAYILAGRPESARPILEGLSTEDPGVSRSDWVEALLKVYLDLGQRGKALVFVRQQLPYLGNAAKLWQLMARLYIDNGEYGNAAAALEVKLSLQPGDREDRRLLGDLYLMAKVPLKAARQYESMLGDNASPGDYEKAASAYLAAHRPDKAAEVLRRGIQHCATSRLWWLLASVCYETEDFEQAIQACTKSSELDPRNADADLMMGYCALQLDRPQDARAAFVNAARNPRQRTEAQKRIQEIDSLAGLVQAGKGALNR
jgi:tetratricopeptide (TPR) repeat protein